MSYTEADITRTVKDEIKSKLCECIKVANQEFNSYFQMPTLEYTLNGVTAGQANSSVNLIQINPTLLLENIEDYIAQTISHEFAHIVTDSIFPTGHFNKNKVTKRVPHHGSGWKYVMNILGAKPMIYHNYCTQTLTGRQTKFDKCEVIYTTNRFSTRAKILELFIDQAGTTPAGSATYYTTLRKKYDH